MEGPVEKGSWWLIGLKVKNSQSAGAKQGPLAQALLPGEAGTELPACWLSQP